MKNWWQAWKFFLKPTKFKVILGILLYLLMPFYNMFFKCYGFLCPKITFYGGILVLRETTRELTQGIPSDFFVAIVFQMITLAIPYLVACLLSALYNNIK